ncbi:hypothetical protein HPB51_026976 [Rhipicephalus microplus]|uniref:CCHC-type domain-containing protein n=1 Tax=Rhipicephalus microplus TaxID=6941 RepID=A0A9J6D1S4_RHIMP|nr:hypothetical protein HPB51_026976 [Rhipicephalus microplus]
MIVRDVVLDFDHNKLREMIIQPRKPRALEVKRINDTARIIVLFDVLKVVNYVMCGTSVSRCTLYRRQKDICYVCGRVGHRADVCLAPKNTIFRGAAPRLLPAAEGGGGNALQRHLRRQCRPAAKGVIPIEFLTIIPREKSGACELLDARECRVT